ncbi:NADH-quinone oxidoreductase subunit C [Thermoproteota archaeon]
MTKEEILLSIKEKFKSSISDYFEKSGNRVYIEVNPKDIVGITRYLINDLDARFNIASGMDMRFHTEILYHFTIERVQLLISFRVKLDRDKPSIDSITPLIKGAEWIEREMHELIGIDFPGHPNLERLLLPDDWPEGVYPLRNDYKEWDKSAIRDRGV